MDEIDGNIAPVLLDSFGDSKAADVDQDGKTAFVIYHLSDDGICGFLILWTSCLVWARDMESIRARSSDMDVLHINPDVFGSSILYSTIAHENQHLIHFALTREIRTHGNRVFSGECPSTGSYGNEGGGPGGRSGQLTQLTPQSCLSVVFAGRICTRQRGTIWTGGICSTVSGSPDRRDFQAAAARYMEPFKDCCRGGRISLQSAMPNIPSKENACLYRIGGGKF